jgi:hypothetical protein
MFVENLNRVRQSSNNTTVRTRRDVYSLFLVFLPYAALITIIFIIISCTALDPDLGSIILNVDPGSQIGTVLPDIDMTPVQYDFHGEGPNSSSFNVSDDQLPVFQSGLEYGEWSISVNAKNKDGIIIAQGIQSATIRFGEVTTLQIPVQPVIGYGTLNVTILWNETEIETPSLQGQLIFSSGAPVDLSFIVNNPGQAECVQENIPTGYHTMRIQLFDNDEHVAGAVEVVRIVSNQTTSSVLEFYEINENGLSSPYPRLAMWWPNSWNPNLDMLVRYDYIGWGDWDNMTTLENLKQLNPEQKHFMSMNLTELKWYDWEKNPLLYQVPDVWFLTQVGTALAEDIDETQTTVSVNETTVFESGDTVACGFESMRVISVNHGSRTLTVERGFIRPASAHSAGERIAAHISFWSETWVMNMSTLCPEYDAGNGPERWIDWALRNHLSDNTMDGLILDRLEQTQSWLLYRHARSIDPDCTNSVVTDGYEAFDTAWKEGIQAMLVELRTAIDGNVIIANSIGAFPELLNGSIYESCPGNWSDSVAETYDDWEEDVLGEEGYINVSKNGFVPNFSLVETYEFEGYPDDNLRDNPSFVPDYQRMRWGITTALLGDGYFSYEISTYGHGNLGLMWFDEYDNAGQGKGYLGYPISDTFIVQDFGYDGKVFRRNFDKGIVICNPSERVATVALGGEYRLISGVQEPGVNTGEWIDTVVISPKDGRILVN